MQTTGAAVCSARGGSTLAVSGMNGRWPGGCDSETARADLQSACGDAMGKSEDWEAYGAKKKGGDAAAGDAGAGDEETGDDFEEEETGETCDMPDMRPIPKSDLADTGAKAKSGDKEGEGEGGKEGDDAKLEGAGSA